MRRKKIGTKITFFLLISAFLPLTLFTFTSYTKVKKSLEDTVQKNLLSLSLRVGEEVANSIADGKRSIALLSENPIISSETESEEEKLKELWKVQEFHKIFEDVTLLNADGNVVLSTTYNYRGDWKAKSSFQQANSGEIAMSDVHIILDPKKYVIVLSAPIVNDASEIIGVVAGQINMEEIWKMTDNIVLDGDSYVVLLDRFDTIIAHPHKEEIFKKFSINIISNSLYEKGDAVRFIDTNGTHYIGVSSTITNDVLKEKSWTVFVAVSKTSAFHPVVILRRNILILFVVCLFVAILISFLLTRSIIQPILRLREVVERAGRGDFSKTIQVHSSDEIGILEKSFQKMLSDLKLSREKLEEYSHGLEDIIKERTKELYKNNEKLLKLNTEFNDITVLREKRIQELKKRIQELEEKKGGIKDSLSLS